MNNYVIQLLNKINNTKVINLSLDITDEYFGKGSLVVCNIKMNKMTYQFVICNTNKYINKLVFRYFNKTWSNFYTELNFINDSKYYFYLDNEVISKNKNYKLLQENYIYSIILKKDKTLIINRKEARKEK